MQSQLVLVADEDAAIAMCADQSSVEQAIADGIAEYLSVDPSSVTVHLSCTPNPTPEPTLEPTPAPTPEPTETTTTSPTRAFLLFFRICLGVRPFPVDV